jgi:hypothetical protein
MPSCPNYWIQADNAARMHDALQRIANRTIVRKAITLDFGPSRNRHTGVREIHTFPDGSVLIIHKNGFRETFNRAKRIFVISSKIANEVLTG